MQSASNTCPVQRSITRVKQARKKTLKSSADAKSALVQNPLAITYVVNIYAYDVTIKSSNIFFILRGTSFQTLAPLYLKDVYRQYDWYLGKYNILLSYQKVTRE